MLLAILVILIILFAFGGVFVHPLLFILLALAIIALLGGPGAGWYGGSRRW